MTDEQVESLGQPTGEAQTGAQQGINPAWEDVLTHVPEDARPQVEQVLRSWDANVTKEFQKRAERLKQLERFERLGLHDWPDEEIEAAASLLQLARDDPDAFDEWLLAAAQERGILDRLQGGEPGYDTGDEEPDLEDTPDQGGVDLDELLEEKLAPIAQWIAEREQERQLAEIDKQIDETLAALHQKHGDFPDDAVLTIARGLVGTDGADDVPTVLEAAVKQYQSMLKAGQEKLLERSEKAPAPAQNGGAPVAEPQRITTFAQAAQAARAMLEGNVGQ